MNPTQLKNAPKYSMRNRVSIEESEGCGCYCCCEVFSKLGITEWTDKGETAICPKCGVDAVIAQSMSVPLDKESLKEMQQYWFAK